MGPHGLNLVNGVKRLTLKFFVNNLCMNAGQLAPRSCPLNEQGSPITVA
jgi:hypothetical protein